VAGNSKLVASSARRMDRSETPDNEMLSNSSNKKRVEATIITFLLEQSSSLVAGELRTRVG
jgi:hypothetical protein